MNNRLKIIIGVEILILLGLFLHVIRNPHLLILMALALLFTFLANRLRNGFFRVLSIVLWAVSTLIFITAGWFWLAILFPILMVILFWRNHPRSEPVNPRFQGFYEEEKEEPNLQTETGNDIIDLADVDYKSSGNRLTIKKASGNTKILVPEDVAVAVEVTTHSGIVTIFGESSINPQRLRYFSENAEAASKKIAIEILVESGNVELVRA